VWQYPLHGERTFLWLMALDKWKFPFSERVVPSGLQQRQQEIPSSICSKVLLSSDVYWSSRIASSSNLDTAPSIDNPFRCSSKQNHGHEPDRNPARSPKEAKMPIKQLPVGSIRDLLNLVSSPSPTFVHLTVISRAEPMLLGIGIDILSLSRLEGLIGRRGGDALARRICCPRELEEFRGKPERTIKDEVRFLSTR